MQMPDQPDANRTVRQAGTSPQVLILVGANFFCCATHSGPIFHIVSCAEICGVAPLLAVLISSVEGIAGMSGRIGVGLTGDRLGAKHVLVTGLLIQAIGGRGDCFAHHLSEFYAVAILFGFICAGIMRLFSVLLREIFPMKMPGILMGGTGMAGSLGMATGSVLGGWIFGTTGLWGSRHHLLRPGPVCLPDRCHLPPLCKTADGGRCATSPESIRVTPKIILHLPHGSETLQGWHLRLYPVIRELAARDAIRLEIRPRDHDLKPATRRPPDDRFADGNLHIIDDRSVQAPNVLNAAVAYFWEFWHLDPVGTKAFSSIGAQDYDPMDMPYPRAKQFFTTQRARLVEKRLSKYAQKSDTTRLPKSSIAVFFQGDFPLHQGVTTFTDLTMLDAVRAHAGDRPIVVKPHPLATDPLTWAEAQAAARHDTRITFTDANVHDILATCAATVSINSTVALEGFLHRKPAILFGQSDFHHFAARVTTKADFAPALSAELTRQGGYAQYLAWYFLRHCLRLGAPDLSTQIWQRFATAGFPKERFLGPP